MVLFRLCNGSLASSTKILTNFLCPTVTYFYRYLQACRERDLDVSVREGVDTLLMYLYRALNRVEDMETLASSENSCVVVWVYLSLFTQLAERSFY